MHLKGREEDAEESGNHAGKGLLRGLGYLSLEMRILEEDQKVEATFESFFYIVSSSHSFPLSFVPSLFLPIYFTYPSSLKLFPKVVMFWFGSMTRVLFTCVP